MFVLLGHIWAAVEVSGSVNSRSRVHQESSVVYAPRRCRESSWERNSHQRVCMSFPHLLLCRWCGNPKETPKLTWSSGHWCIFVCIYLHGRDHRIVSHWLRTGFVRIVTDEVLQLICFQTTTDLITILVNSVSIIGGSTHTSQFAHFTIFSWIICHCVGPLPAPTAARVMGGMCRYVWCVSIFRCKLAPKMPNRKRVRGIGRQTVRVQDKDLFDPSQS